MHGGRWRWSGVASLTVWWGLLLAFWIALTDNTRPLELLAGAVSALVAATVLQLVVAIGGVRLAVRPRWLVRSLAAPWWAVRDSVILLWAVPARRRGRLRAVPFAAGGSAPLDRGRRAVAFGVGSAGPNQYVIAESGEDDVLVIHELVPTSAVTAVDLVREP
jgi:hypothetical protein